MSKTHEKIIHALIGEQAGQQNVLSVPRLYLRVLGGDVIAALWLSQMVYWQYKKPGGEIAKSYADWEEELCLSASQVKRAITKCKSIGIKISTVKRKSPFYNMAPVLHYRLDIDRLAGVLSDFLIIHSEESSQSDSEETSQSIITENTTETTKDSAASVGEENPTPEPPPMSGDEGGDRQPNTPKTLSQLAREDPELQAAIADNARQSVKGLVGGDGRRRGKRKKRNDYDIARYNPHKADILQAIATEYHGKPYMNLCYSERGQVVDASADFQDANQARHTVAYAYHMVATQQWPGICAVVNLGKYRTAAEKWRAKVSAPRLTIADDNFEAGA